MSEHKFKVGDKVRRIESELSEYWVQDCKKEGKNPHDIYTVAYVSSAGGIDVGVDGHYPWSFFNFELVTKANSKPIPIEKYIAIIDQEDCAICRTNNYQDALDKAKNQSYDATIYKMIPVSKVQNIRKVIMCRTLGKL